jgi:hypothetical protein
VTEAEGAVKRLTYAVKRIPAAQLRRCGWFDFLTDPVPYHYDVPDVLCDAFDCLGLSETGNWNQIHEVLVAFLAYLGEEMDRSVTSSEVQALRSLLLDTPVDQSKLHRWFALPLATRRVAP